jgi:hypothetical protein
MLALVASPLHAAESDAGASSCERIRASVHRLAESEHAEAFALALASGGGGAVEIVAARLPELEIQAVQLRATLRDISSRGSPRDAAAERCVREGFRALDTAERLMSDVEEILIAWTPIRAPEAETSAPGATRSPAPERPR